MLRKGGSMCLWKASLDMWWELKKCRVTKKNPSHGCLKMMFLAALGITVVQAEKYLINSLALSPRCGCLGNLHAQYSFQDKLLGIAVHILHHCSSAPCIRLKSYTLKIVPPKVKMTVLSSLCAWHLGTRFKVYSK